MAVAEPHQMIGGSTAPPARIGPLGRGGSGIRIRAWSGVGLLAVVTLVAMLARVIAPYDPLLPAGPPLLAPGTQGFLLGTDGIGRDVLSRVLAGLQLSWFAALAVIASGLLVGGAIGVLAGAAGGWVDNLLMRVTDLFLSLPAPLLAIAVVAALGGGLGNTLLAVSIVWWPFYARIVRGEVRTWRVRPHIDAARLSGVGGIRLALRHLLPGAAPAAVVTASLDVGNLVLTLAGLSFLGLGQPAPAAELGADTARNLSYLLQQWWIPVMPGLAVLVLALAGNVAGDGIRTWLDRR